MNELLAWLSRLFSSWRPWLVIQPWDVGVRVRLGKNATKLSCGLHFRVPLLDQISLVNTRVRISTTPPVTIGNGHKTTARVISATVGFRISDPLKAMLTYTQPPVAVLSYAQATVSRNLSAEECLASVRREFDDSGIEITFLYFTENVEVKTYRILNSHGGLYGESAPAMVPAGDSGTGLGF